MPKGPLNTSSTFVPLIFTVFLFLLWLSSSGRLEKIKAAMANPQMPQPGGLSGVHENGGSLDPLVPGTPGINGAIRPIPGLTPKTKDSEFPPLPHVPGTPDWSKK